MLQISPASLQDVFVITPTPIEDARGFYMRVFSTDLHAQAGVDHTRLVQENQSRSRRGVLRGLHTRRHLSEAKLVRCVRGAVWDVAVDLRPWSPTFLRWEGFELDEDTNRQVYIPHGFAHGFQALTELADVVYKVDDFYRPDLDQAIAYDDPDLAIPWPLPDPITSERDRTAPRLREVKDQLGEWYGDHGA
jgi:dTDP-4-dehydrorhamnose 3,5-epimerase